MLKVVLVDDEDVIIEGLKVLVPWEKCGFQIAGEAYDGEEAVELLQKVRPDVVITDIRMPLLSGLEMIDRIMEFLPDAHIIILSGYSDFEYAREAMNKGANCYLLKPVSREDLMHHLALIREKIEKQREREAKIERIHTNLYNMRGAAKEKYLKDLVDRRILPGKSIAKIWQTFEFGPVPEQMCAVIFEIDRFDVADFHMPEDKPSLKFGVDNILEEMIMETNVGVFFSYDDEHSVLIACSHMQKKLKNEMLDVINEIKIMVKEALSVTISVGIGRIVNDPYCLWESFDQARKALEKKFVFGENIIVEFDSIASVGEAGVFRPVPLMWELIEKVKSGNWQEVAVLFDSFFQYMLRVLKSTPHQIYIECVNLLVLLRQNLPEPIVVNSRLNQQEIYRASYLEQFKTYKELQKWMSLFLHDLTGEICRQPVSHNEKLVEAIKKYVEQYYDDSTRATVANHFFINPSYLSQMFKQTSGESFNDYLTSIRVKAAKRLLVQTDYKMQFIAEKIGYTSSQHFSKVFEKNEGISPSDYRKRHQR